jgi:hypothetical protein
MPLYYPAELSDPELNPQFRRRWSERPPPKRARPAPSLRGSRPLSSSLQVQGDHTRSAATAPRRKRRSAPSFKLVRITRKLLDPRRAP